MKKQNPYHDDSMWKGAPPESFAKAMELRRNMTKQELIIWERLKSNQLDGIKFRRQHPIQLFIADFYCHQHKLVIELDGGYHLADEQMKKDAERTEILNSYNLRVIRFTNEEVDIDIEKVLEKIRLIIKEGT